MFFGGGQNARQADHEEITDQMRTDGLRFPAHVFLFEPGRPDGDGGFDVTLRFHDDLDPFAEYYKHEILMSNSCVAGPPR